MSALVYWAPGQGSCVFRPAIAVCALAAALLAAPGAASACPSYVGVKSFKGTADTSFIQSATGEYEPGPSALSGISTASINEVATGLQLKSLKPLPYKHSVLGASPSFTGPTTGGTISVHDTLDDEWAVGDRSTGSQNASGPAQTGPTGKATTGSVALTPEGRGGKPLPLTGHGAGILSGCKYQVSVIYTILSTIATMPSSGPYALPIPEDWRMTFSAISPPMPIPAGLHLSGTASLPLYGANPNADFYEDGGSAWGTATGALSSILIYNKMPLNTATFSWNLKPAFAKGHKKHK